MSSDPRVDAYVAAAAPFAQPILKHLRAAVHAGCPEVVESEYIEWIADAKGDATRTRRLAQAVQWIAEGKSRNWKYRG